MKKYIIFLFISVFTLPFVSCDDILDVDSDQIVTLDENKLQSDSLFSMGGIYSQLQKLADSYVILGELRGDLLESGVYADKYLHEISYFGDYSKDNPYTSNKADYYAVINNCNYVIHNIDTSRIFKGEKTMYRVLAAAKGVRAWTYMQLALNFDEVYYYEQPLLSLEDLATLGTAIKFDELAPKLIADLLPFKDTKRLRLQPFAGFSRTELLNFSIPFLLGDLYLWTGQYENAANAYHDLIYEGGVTYLIDEYYKDTRVVSGTGQTLAFTGDIQRYWHRIFSGKYALEYITVIAATNEFERITALDSLFVPAKLQTSSSSPVLITDYYPVLAPTEVAIANFDSALYFQAYYVAAGETHALTTPGDLRKYGTLLNITLGNDATGLTRINYVGKYLQMNSTTSESEKAQMILPYRAGLLYLRYAEAVNRLGKPNLAMALLKSGLNAKNLANPKVIPPHEIQDPLPNYMNFKDTRFDASIGIRERGLGQQHLDTTFYIIKTGLAEPTLLDSVLYVENLIQKELALETAYEGNRFHDLMRLSIRRNDNDYLAKIVSSKYAAESLRASVRTKLNNRDKWYIK